MSGLLVRAFLLVALIVNPLFAQSNDDPIKRAEFEFNKIQSPLTGTIPDNIYNRENKFHRDRFQKPGIEKSVEQTQGATWVSRGPNNIGGRTRALAIDVKNENVLIAGGVSGGIWRSIDEGQSWTRTTDKDQMPSVSCIVQDTRMGMESTWYYGTGEFISNSASSRNQITPFTGNGIFKSTDNGITWVNLISTADDLPQKISDFDYVWNIVVNPVSKGKGELFAAVRGGIYRSGDGGDNWEQVLGNPPDSLHRSDYTDIAVTKDGVLYAALSRKDATHIQAKTGIFRSTDGKNWVNITPDSFDKLFGRIQIAIAPSDNKILYFLGVRYISSSAGDVVSSNMLWKLIDNNYIETKNLNWFNLTVNLPKLVLYSGYCLVIKVKPDNPDVVFVGGSSLFRSTDGFATDNSLQIGGYNPDYVSYSSDKYKNLLWYKMFYPNHYPDQHSMVFMPSNPNVMISGCDGGIYKTLNNTAQKIEWIPLNNGYISSQFYTLAINESQPGDYTVIGGMQDRNTWGSKTPTQLNWQAISGADGSFCAIPKDSKYLFVSCQRAFLYRAEMNSDFVPVSLESMNSFMYFSMFINPFEMDPNDNGIIYLPLYSDIYRNKSLLKDSIDKEWEKILSQQYSGGAISAISVSNQPPNMLFFSSYNQMGKPEIKMISNANDNYSAPADIGDNNFPTGGYVECLTVDPNDADKIMAVFSNYEIPSLFYTSDGGKAWVDVSGNLEENPDGSGAGPSCRWADVLHLSDKTKWFVGTSIGLYSTEKLDGANTIWVQEGANSIGRVVVPMVKARDSDGFVAAATHGNGMFTAQYTVNEPANSFTFYLEAPYPNPAKTSCSVTYTLPRNMQISLILYDPTGRKVADIAAGQAEAGKHTLDIPLNDYKSGAYFLKLSSGGLSQTKMIIIEK